MILIVSTVAIALGAFVATSPTRAARIRAPERFGRMSPQDRIPFLRWYRVFGLLLCLAGVLAAIDSIVFSKYH
jgi:hypothetical protein